MVRILDTTREFDSFAKEAALESPMVRENLWRDRYRAVYQNVFDAFYAGYGSPEGMHALVRELSKVRPRVKDAAPVVRGLIEEVEPAVRETLAAEDCPEPLHVLMVGTFSTNAFVGRLDDEVALFHCLEWFPEPQPARVLIAHEDTHAWHESILDEAPPKDLSWTAFYEGLAIQTSRMVVPDQPEQDYFWYGVSGFEDWLPWCREHREQLLERLRESLDDEDAAETFFGEGLIEGRWRVGYFLADVLVKELDKPPQELIRMGVEDARQAIRGALKA